MESYLILYLKFTQFDCTLYFYYFFQAIDHLGENNFFNSNISEIVHQGGFLTKQKNLLSDSQSIYLQSPNKQ